MYAPAMNKNKESKSRAAPNNVGRRKSDEKQGFGFADNLHEVTIQRTSILSSIQKSPKVIQRTKKKYVICADETVKEVDENYELAKQERFITEWKYRFALIRQANEDTVSEDEFSDEEEKLKKTDESGHEENIKTKTVKGLGDKDEPAGLQSRKLLKKYYKEGERVYEGEGKDLLSKIKKDRAVLILFNKKPDIFLKIIGWETMNQKIEGFPEVGLCIRMSLFPKSKFNVRTSFPGCTQDTIIHYHVDDKEISITKVHRHRSLKTSGPKNRFIDMIKEQASGVRLLGKGTSYTTDAIKDEASGAFGYNVWPKRGFDQEVTEQWIQKMINDKDKKNTKAIRWLRNAKKKGSIRFSDMFSVEDKEIYDQLKNLWRKHGGAETLEFDVTKDSKSYATLNRYIRDQKSKAPAKKK